MTIVGIAGPTPGRSSFSRQRVHVDYGFAPASPVGQGFLHAHHLDKFGGVHVGDDVQFEVVGRYLARVGHEPEPLDVLGGVITSNRAVYERLGLFDDPIRGNGSYEIVIEATDIAHDPRHTVPCWAPTEVIDQLLLDIFPCATLPEWKHVRDNAGPITQKIETIDV